MSKYAFAFENGKVVAFLNTQFLEKAIKSGRNLKPTTSEDAKNAMISQIKEVGKSESGEYGKWVCNLDFTDKTAESVFSRYADIVNLWVLWVPKIL